MLRRTAISTIMIVLMAAASAQAVHFGWQSLSDGGIEYIVQVEPDLMDVFRAQGFSSDIPAGLRDVRRIRLVMGNQRLPNQDDIIGPPPAPVPQRQNADSKTPARAEIAAPGKIEPAADAEKTAPAEKTAERSPTAEMLRFFQPGPMRQIRPTEAGPVETGAVRPADERVKPSSAAILSNASEAQQNGDKPSAPLTPKPWFLLMAVLLALFASLGANVYLAWIHQAVRSKYRSLLQQLPGGAAA